MFKLVILFYLELGSTCLIKFALLLNKKRLFCADFFPRWLGMRTSYTWKFDMAFYSIGSEVLTCFRLLPGRILVSDACTRHRAHPPRPQVRVPRSRLLRLGRSGGAGVSEQIPLHVLRSVHHIADRCGGSDHQLHDWSAGSQICELMFSIFMGLWGGTVGPRSLPSYRELCL